MSELEELPFVDVGQARRDAGARLLLGTQRVSEFGGVTPGWKGVVEVSGSEGGESFGRVLAALYLVGQAGWGVKDDAGTAVGPAPAEERVVCSKEMNALLLRVFAQEPSLVPVWCAGAEKKKVLPWPEHVPALLSHAANMPAGSATARGIVQAAGQRAAWLIPLNGAWKRLAGTAQGHEAQAGVAWEETAGEKRVRVFESMRRENPGKGLELLEKAWPDEPAETRVKLLEGLGVGLSMGDEAFLEGLLDDKRKTVREKAAQVLGRLEGSRLAKRMEERLAAWVRAQGGKLEVSVPGEMDKAMARDGMTDKPVGAQMGAKAWLLHQVVSGVPLGRWDEVMGLTPEAWVKPGAAGEWSDNLWQGWCASWDRWPTDRWTQAILARSWELGETDVTGRVLERMDGRAHEEALLPRLTGAAYGKGLSEHPVFSVLKRTEHAWSAGLTEAFISAVGRVFGQFDTSDHWYAQSMIQTLADCLDGVTMTGHMDGKNLPEDRREAWQKLFKNVVNKIEIRAAIHKEMNA